MRDLRRHIFIILVTILVIVVGVWAYKEYTARPQEPEIYPGWDYTIIDRLQQDITYNGSKTYIIPKLGRTTINVVDYTTTISGGPFTLWRKNVTTENVYTRLNKDIQVLDLLLICNTSSEFIVHTEMGEFVSRCLSLERLTWDYRKVQGVYSLNPDDKPSMTFIVSNINDYPISLSVTVFGVMSREEVAILRTWVDLKTGEPIMEEEE